MDILKGLNESQLEAVTSTEGYIRVIAGAGSGKTRALSTRFYYLVEGIGILPKNILCVTFTNKAAAEMRSRIHNMTGDNDTGFICTFHSLCVSILQEDSNIVNYPKSFLVLDNADIDTMLSVIYEEKHLSLRDMTFSNARDMIEMQKLYEKPDYYLDLLNLSMEDLRKKYDTAETVKDIIFYGYLWQQRKCFGFDYNDLIKVTLYIFSLSEDVRLKWQKRLEYIMVDEFQDIDDIQYRLMKELSGYHHNLFVVGDPDQTIYTWRGANIGYLIDFDKEFSPAKTIMMMENYRSTPEIINAANSLIDTNVTRIKKDLIPTLPSGEPVVFHHSQSSKDENQWIADKITELSKSGVSLNDIAILYRAHYVSRGVEDALLTAKIPYKIYSGVAFFNRMEIKDALSYLRMIVYKDDLSFMRIINTPKRNIGKRRIEALTEYSEQNKCTLYNALLSLCDTEIFQSTKARDFISLVEKYATSYESRNVSEVMKGLINDSGYEMKLRTEGSQERLDNLAELLQSIYDYENSIGEECDIVNYLSHIALFTNQDIPNDGEKVKLMTVHAAKGLEFPYVFLVSLNEGIFPSKKTDSLPGMEEERRLFYVAMTRAQRLLYFTDSGGRNLDGSVRFPSRFVLDIDNTLITYDNPPDEGLIKAATQFSKVNTLRLQNEKDSDFLTEGTRINHSIMGDGTILSVDTTDKAYLIKFDSIDTPRKISCKVKLNSLE